MSQGAASGPVPLKERYFEDYTAGEVIEFGDRLVTQDEIIEFARRYDPQPFHTDPVAAQQSAFGTLVASGWMTASIGMALSVEHFVSPLSSMGSPGVEKLEWLQPVKPGDRLHMRITVLETKRSRSKPDRGVMRLRQELINQADQTVMRQEGLIMQRCRDAAPQA